MGNDPPTFARMFLQREEILTRRGILHHLSDGILAFDKSHKAIYKNTAGSIFYTAGEIREGHPLYTDYIKSMNNWMQKTGFTVGINGRSCIASIIPVIVILRDRTEIVHLNEQIMGTNHIVDALRANTHEFLNKLHVISGLLQFGEIDKAVDFIDSRAKELNIQFSLRQDSYLPVHNKFLSTQEIITIIGNLTENAFDAINGKESDRNTEIFIFCDENGISISIDDTCCGMSGEQIHNILSGKSFTTKEAGHDYRMRFIRDIMRLHDGRDALAFLEKNEADLLLLDLYMPDIDGLEILKRLRSRNNQAGVRLTMPYTLRRLWRDEQTSEGPAEEDARHYSRCPEESCS